MMSCPVVKKLVLISGLRPFVHPESQINWSLCIACPWAARYNPFPYMMALQTPPVPPTTPSTRLQVLFSKQTCHPQRRELGEAWGRALESHWP